MIKIRITGTVFRYDESGTMSIVELTYSTTDPKQQIYANGQIPITTAEFFQASGLDSMSDMVKAKLIERLEETEEEPIEQ
ncbi:hypothetical protein [Alkalicoccobacillus murimartini]|uniref:Phage protein n=1 Tax=Alkalicoccobacillus murimartini TaxID=171685 RepID=A0ABT9YM40_9BACI|nr:hypothetical protein [Alkalicoccobacillus murimartini]MDQ0208942.1 hypothetical protein [Alkalicoccobacillus murimartini]